MVYIVPGTFVLIIIIILYSSLASTKLKRAKILMEKGEYVKATLILESIFNEQQKAPLLLAEVRYRQGMSELNDNQDYSLDLFNKILTLKKKLPQKTDIKKFEVIESLAYLEIAKINYARAEKSLNIGEKIKRLKDSVKFIENAIKSDRINIFNELIKQHYRELTNCYYQIGTNAEKQLKILDAIGYYQKMYEYAKKMDDKSYVNIAEGRLLITKLKIRDQIDEKKIVKILKAPEAIKHDFFYRFAYQMIHEGKYTEAEGILNKHFLKSTPQIKKLRAIILSEKQKRALKQIEIINQGIEKLYEEEIMVYEIKNLYEQIDEQIPFLVSVIPDIKENLEELKPSLFNRLLVHFIEQKQYGSAINLILKYPQFWEKPELLKDLGICCFGYVNQGNMTDINYKTIISSWLTAVFSDEVILKSLEDTSWDDDYTFTLIDSIGSNYELHKNLPENVNYDEVTETNISIGNTQRELLSQFENLMQQKTESLDSFERFEDFYLFEKEAIKSTVRIIAKDRLFAAPYFAKKYGIAEGILADLEEEYISYSDEESLEAGIPYVDANSNTNVGDYATAKDLMRSLLIEITNINIESVKSYLALNNVNLIQKFAGISSTYEEATYSAIAQVIEEDDENEDIIRIMELVITAAKNGDKLKYQYANYVANYCIGKINDHKISNLSALKLMKKAYMYCPDVSRIARNIVTLIRFNLLDIIYNQTVKADEIYSILDSIYSKRTKVFIEATLELSNAKIEILDKLKDTGVNIDLFDSKVVIINGPSLNEDGERIKRALSYFEKMSSSLQTTKIPNERIGLNWSILNNFYR